MDDCEYQQEEEDDDQQEFDIDVELLQGLTLEDVAFALSQLVAGSELAAVVIGPDDGSDVDGTATPRS